MSTLVGLSVALGGPALAGPGLNTGDPLGFFSATADRLLRAQFGFGVTNIPVFTNAPPSVTNVNPFLYSPGVHRLLQLAANIYAATTNRLYPGATNAPFLPSVFRPVFRRDAAGNIFIAGYVEEDDDRLVASPPAFVDVTDPVSRDQIRSTGTVIDPSDPTEPMVYGVPLVIGAKKGLPGFNEFSMESVSQITRKLQITRPNINSMAGAQTNQMFVLGISNVLGVEVWNSYRSNYTRPVDLIVDCDLTMVLTNDYGTPTVTVNGSQQALSFHQNVHGTFSTNNWQGYTGLQVTLNQDKLSFQIPLLTNVVFLSDAVYRFAGNQLLTNPSSTFETGVGFPDPQWNLAITNKLRFAMVDSASGRLIDYVLLNGLTDNRHLRQEITAADYGVAGLWDTNRIGGPGLNFPPNGVNNQIQIALGYAPVSLSDWIFITAGPPLQDYEIAVFRAFFNTLTHIGIYNGIVASNLNLVADVPFVPARRMSKSWSWQANDPLVHYTFGDLLYLDLFITNAAVPESLAVPVQTLNNISAVNNRFQPWGGYPLNPDPNNPYNLAIKDPRVTRSDDWDFPEGEPLSLAMLGHVHRGTPWQTVYLKDTNILSSPLGLSTWQKWTGNIDSNDATRTAPVQDQLVINALISAFNTNSPRQLMSVSTPDPNAWLAVLDGIQVLTNISTTTLDTRVMSSNSPQAALIADAIFSARGARPNGRFRSLGDLLAIPQLSTASPWLDQTTSAQLQRGVSDEAYEAIPAQLLMRLRPDSVASFSQTNGTAKLCFTGLDDYSYAVEVSSNLVDWQAVATNSPTNGVFEFFEVPPDSSRRFYRSSVLP